MTDTLDVYAPYVAGDHRDSCAGLCTNWGRNGCEMEHACWCVDGALSYAEFQAKHPPMTGVSA